MRIKKGYIQVYTGNGKGKTTAAFGQALRAAGSGLNVFIVQFMKNFPYGEIESIRVLKDFIGLEQYGDDTFVLERKPPGVKELRAATQAMHRAREAMLSEKFDIVILDEVCIAIYFSLLKTEDVIAILDEKPEPVELILTGRYCPPEIIAKADLVTEMMEIKHYYQKGVLARKGIES